MSLNPVPAVDDALFSGPLIGASLWYLPLLSYVIIFDTWLFHGCVGILESKSGVVMESTRLPCQFYTVLKMSCKGSALNDAWRHKVAVKRSLFSTCCTPPKYREPWALFSLVFLLNTLEDCGARVGLWRPNRLKPDLWWSQPSCEEGGDIESHALQSISSLVEKLVPVLTGIHMCIHSTLPCTCPPLTLTPTVSSLKFGQNSLLNQKFIAGWDGGPGQSRKFANTGSLYSPLYQASWLLHVVESPVSLLISPKCATANPRELAQSAGLQRKWDFSWPVSSNSSSIPRHISIN